MLALQLYSCNQFMVFMHVAGSMHSSLQLLSLMFKRLCNTSWRGPRAAGPEQTSGGAAGAQPGRDQQRGCRLGQASSVGGLSQGGVLHPQLLFIFVFKNHCNNLHSFKKRESTVLLGEILNENNLCKFGHILVTNISSNTGVCRIDDKLLPRVQTPKKWLNSTLVHGAAAVLPAIIFLSWKTKSDYWNTQAQTRSGTWRNQPDAPHKRWAHMPWF